MGAEGDAAGIAAEDVAEGAAEDVAEDVAEGGAEDVAEDVVGGAGGAANILVAGEGRHDAGWEAAASDASQLHEP